MTARTPSRVATLRAAAVVVMAVVLVASPIAGGAALPGPAGPADTTDQRTQRMADMAQTLQAGDYLYAGTGDNTVEKLDPNDLSTVATYSGHTDNVNDVAYDSSGGHLYSASADGTVEQLNPGDMTSNQTFTAPTTPVQAIAIGPDNIFTGGNGNSIYKVSKSGMTEMANLSVSDTVRGLVYGNGSLYAAVDDGTCLKIDPSAMSQQQSHNVGGFSRGIDYGNGHVYCGGDSHTVYKLDDTDLSEVANGTVTAGSGTIPVEIDYAADGNLYVGLDNVSRLDPSTMTETDTSGEDANINTILYGPKATVHSGINSGDVRAHSDDLSVLSSSNIATGAVKALATGDTDAVAGVTGRVVDQAGDPVKRKNVTVDLWGVRESAFDISDVYRREQKARQLLDELSDPLPDAYKPDRDLQSDFEATDDHYVAVNSRLQWETQITATDNPVDLKLAFDEGETVVLSCWNPNAGGFPPLEAEIDPTYPGRVDRCIFNIEKLSPTGEVIDSWTAGNSHVYKENYLVGGRTHPVLRTEFSPGIYRVSTDDPASNFSVVFAVGAGSLEETMREGLKDRHEELTDQADRIRERLNNDELWQTTVTTNSTGHWTADVPDNVDIVQVQAYDTPAGVDNTASISSLRDHFTATDVTQTQVLLSTSPAKFDNPPSTEPVEVTVVRADTSQWKDDLSAWQQKLQDLLDQYLNQTITDLEAQFEDRLEQLIRENLLQRYADYRQLIEADHSLTADYLEASQFESIQDGPSLTNAQLRTETTLMREAFISASDPDAVPDPEPDPSEGTITVEFPTEGDIKQANPEVVWSNGTVQPVPDDQWSIETFGDDTLVVNLNVSDDPAVAKIRANMVMANGDTASPSAPIVRPGFGGTVPEIDAIDVSSLRPGPDEEVAIKLRPANGGGYQQLESATVYGPDGNKLTTTITDSDRLKFMTNGTGTHFVQLTYASTSGDTFVTTVRLEAGEESRTERPTVRLAETPYGPTPLAGEDLESAHYDQSGNTHRVTAVTPAGERISKLDVRAGTTLAGDRTELVVRVVEGEAEQTINNHVTVTVHLDRGLDEVTSGLRTAAMVTVNDDPVTHAGTSAGDIQDRQDGKATITVVTDADGQAEIVIDESPSIPKRVGWWADNNLPDLPSLPVAILPAGLALVPVFRRRAASG